MKPQTKVFFRRFALRWLRKLVDLADDRLHAAEVQFREAAASERDERSRLVIGARPSPEGRLLRMTPPQPQRETFAEWEMRKSGVAPASKKAARKHRERLTAAAFDLRFAR
jgi:hypothetical protein